MSGFPKGNNGRRLAGEISRWLFYVSVSTLWLGLMFLMFIHQATPFLWVGLAGTVVTHSLTERFIPGGLSFSRWGWVRHMSLAMLFIGLQFLSWRYFYFFRDPERAIPKEPAVLSPADGFVVYIRPVTAGSVPLAIKNGTPIPLSEILKMESPLPDGILLGIFMTPMSVHVNRAPITGVVEQRTYFQGTSMKSMMPMAIRTILGRKPFERGSQHILQNERETLLIRGQFPVVLTRIADPYVDKIVTWKGQGVSVLQGERLGLIKMGSQADVLFPARVAGRPARVHVKEGQYVYAGSTILVTYE